MLQVTVETVQDGHMPGDRMPLATAVRLTSVPDASATVTSSPWTPLGTDIRRHFKAFAKSHYHGQVL